MTYREIDNQYEQLRNTFSGLALTYERHQYFRQRFTNSFAAGYILGFGLIVFLVAQNLMNSVFFPGYLVAFGAAIILTLYNRNQMLKRRVSDNEVTIVKTLYACRAINEYLRTNLHDTTKQIAKDKIIDLVADLRLWLGKKSPHFMAKPILDLISGLESGTILAVEIAHQHGVSRSNEALHLLLGYVSAGDNLNVEHINAVNSLLSDLRLPEPVKKPKIDIRAQYLKLQPRIRNKFVSSGIIAAIAVISAFAWLYGVPVMLFTDSADLKTQVSSMGFLMILLAGAGIVANNMRQYKEPQTKTI